MRDSPKWLPWVVALAFFLGVAVAQSTAQEKIKVAGKLVAAVTESDALKIGDTEGHGFLMSKSEGMNTSTGKNSFMDGALIVNYNWADLIKGNGPHQGYIILSSEAGSGVAQWSGKVKTAMSPGNAPVTTMEGTYTYTKGTGRFENIQGGGTYKGRYISEKAYVVEWEGEYSIQK